MVMKKRIEGVSPAISAHWVRRFEKFVRVSDFKTSRGLHSRREVQLTNSRNCGQALMIRKKVNGWVEVGRCFGEPIRECRVTAHSG